MKLSAWGEYYSTRLGWISFLSDILLHWPYLGSVLLARPRLVLEAGCGPGFHSLFLGLLLRRTRFVLVDKDLTVLRIAKVTTKSLGYRVYLCQGDILELPFRVDSFDVVISQGTLEHLDDPLFMKAVSEQLRVAPQVIFSVPSDQYLQQDFGDEILRGPEQIRALTQLAHNDLDQNIGYYSFDIGLRTKITFYRYLRSNGCSRHDALRHSLKASFHILGRLRRLPSWRKRRVSQEMSASTTLC